MYGNAFFHIAAGAVVPEQLTRYVRAVSGRVPVVAGEYVAYRHERHAVLVAYPQYVAQVETMTPRAGGATACPQGGLVPPVPLDAALADLRSGCDSVTVLAPFRPIEAPVEVSGEAPVDASGKVPAEVPGKAPVKAFGGASSASHDAYWQIALPAAAPDQKLRNMLRRAGREVTVRAEPWHADHDALVKSYLASRPLPPGTRSIFAALAAYAGGDDENVVLLAARRADASLAAFLIGDFTSLHTAFYMFAFRAPDAPPGSSDLLLRHLVREAEERGHVRVNLGLGINGGIAFFKKKWGAVPFLPYVETTWNFEAKNASVLSTLRSLFSRA